MRSAEVLHPGHHSIRLPNRDYAAPGSYFVTICTHEKHCILSRIANAQIELTPLGRIAKECWLAIPYHFARVTLHGFVIMPNHLHGVLELTAKIEKQRNACDQNSELYRDGVQPGSLSAIVRSFKAAVTKRARIELACAAAVWQRNYFERVIRDGQEFSDVTRYIAENPMKWEWDRENPQGGKF